MMARYFAYRVFIVHGILSYIILANSCEIVIYTTIYTTPNK